MERKPRARFNASVAELEQTRLQDRFRGLGLTPLGELPLRVPVRVAGEVTRVVLTPRAGVPNLEVMISDGTGKITAVFTGRRRIAGLEHGRATIFEGVAMRERTARSSTTPPTRSSPELPILTTLGCAQRN